MKPTKTVKPAKTAQKLSKKITKAQYHSLVAPAFVAWRKEMHTQCGVETSNYARLFTEKRTTGARTKYWYAKELPIKRIAKYLKKNSTFKVGKDVFSVHFVADYANGGCYPIPCSAIYAVKQ